MSSFSPKGGVDFHQQVVNLNSDNVTPTFKNNFNFLKSQGTQTSKVWSVILYFFPSASLFSVSTKCSRFYLGQ